ncbi:hypothetical protein Pan216_55290 [Planctomycetes bacterium Pan216]|uniref:Uncharacterized protein n=1 Tax=Kolteria novifilia TaxID=2527975 RepID=A0A518BCC2_9BACT|nr:hypothetical protein Pan216_55290 [Planctomycetes bacterium Pan216]
MGEQRHLQLLAWRVAGSCALLLGLAIGLWAFAANSAQRDLQHARRTIRQRGEPLSFAELAPDSLDPDHDAAPLLLDATRQFQPPRSGFRNALEWPTNAKRLAALERELDRQQEVLTLVDRALDRDQFHYPYHYAANAPSPPRSSLRPLSAAADLYRGRLRVALHHRDADDATSAILRLFRLGDYLSREALLHDQYFGLVILHRALDDLQITLSRLPLAPKSLLALQARVMEIERYPRARETLIRQRAWVHDQALIAHEGRGQRRPIPKPSPPHAGIPSSFPPLATITRPLVSRRIAQQLRHFTQAIDALETVGPHGEQQWNELREEARDELCFSVVSSFHQRRICYRAWLLGCRQRLRLAGLALGLEHHRSAKGYYPERLTDLIATLPSEQHHCVFSGKGLRYQPDVSGFVVRGPARDNDPTSPLSFEIERPHLDASLGSPATSVVSARRDPR